MEAGDPSTDLHMGLIYQFLTSVISMIIVALPLDLIMKYPQISKNIPMRHLDS